MDSNIKQALDIVELEDRFEMTVASVDTGRCNGNGGGSEVEAIQ